MHHLKVDSSKQGTKLKYIVLSWAVGAHGAGRDRASKGHDHYLACDNAGAQYSGRTCQWIGNKANDEFPAMIRMLNKWMFVKLDNASQKSFRWTSMTIVDESMPARMRAVRRHEESVVATFGTFTGGATCLWPRDDGSEPLDSFQTKDAGIYETQKQLLLLQGGKLHEVESFKGQHITVEWLSPKGVWGISDELKAKLDRLEFKIPKSKEDRHMKWEQSRPVLIGDCVYQRPAGPGDVETTVISEMATHWRPRSVRTSLKAPGGSI